MKAIFILITSLIIGTVTTVNTKKSLVENCDSELSVEKNRSFRSAGENGASFNMILKNTTLKKTTYLLSAKNLDEPCGNKTMKSSGINVPLNTTFELDNSSSSQNEITLNSGQSVKFIVTVNVPNGTPKNNWGCIEIEAKPLGCNSSNAKTILSVYVPSPPRE